MNERTIIGGVSYETIGSNTSNLLLKSNGNIKLQWGNKLIDLIKNGKISSNDNSNQIFIISNESEIKSEGFYILKEDDNFSFIIYKNKQKYNFSGTDLYISTTEKQDFTSEQKSTALKNIGIIYSTLEELKEDNIENGIAYVIENNSLYKIINKEIINFQANVEQIEVEQTEEEEGKIINSSFKIILSISDNQYIILSNSEIKINHPLIIGKNSEIHSEENEFRLYVQDGISYLDIDVIKERKKENIFEYGMIIMFCEKDIPFGWVLCDGKEHIVEGESIIPIDLTDKFIKTEESTDENPVYSLVYIMKV